jgi:hypothetical protein
MPEMIWHPLVHTLRTDYYEDILAFSKETPDIQRILGESN